MDIFSKTKRSDVMRKITSKNTKPELRVRKYLFSKGYRYRLYRKDLPGTPDLVFPKYRMVLFVHGCFWHGHKCRIGSGNRKPKTNTKYWIEKIERNKKRDFINKNKLVKLGWQVIVIWECELDNEKVITKKLKPLLTRKKSA